MPTEETTGNNQQQRKKRLTDSKRFYVIAAFFIYVLAGFAVWWFSTGAYQSLFPHEDIKQLLEKDASHSLLPSIIIVAHYINFKSSPSVGHSLSSKKFIGSINNWTIEQLNNVNGDDQKIDELLNEWIQAKKLDKPNHYHLFIISGQDKETTLYLGKHRHAWTILGADNGVSSIFELYFNILTNSNTSPSKSNQIKNMYDEFGDLASDIIDDSDITVSKTAMKYRITFNVVNMAPFRNYMFDWGSETINFENYIRSFTDSISNLADFLIEWKTVMYGNLPVSGLHSKSADVSKLRKYKTFQNFERRNSNDVDAANATALVPEGQEPYYEIDARSMQFLLNENNDWKFVSQDANETSIQFLVLIPPKESTPLLVRKYDGSVSQHNSYIVPRWGGVLVFNPSKHVYKNTGLKTLDSEDVQYIMEVFTNQLRRLLSIPPPTPSTVKIDSKGLSKVKITYISSLKFGVSQWEIDQLYRHRIQNNLLRAVETLKSMSRVVYNMPNVYVWDIVAELTRESIENVHQALSMINNNEIEKLDELLAKSKTAIYSAERAFGHESMLSMLHFPDSQKLAIYLPLVLPIVITILVGFKREKNVLADKLKPTPAAQQE
ncbi:predicted protein [Naegleria gruberi]|uniref:Predicted protein n=1 Tax=Naegleria gruberi TaxID=5762 RepID=D2VKY6_NAEGR|nr:uncharacterized protein NAEGRDRAFT_50423 [Naegleria gruberi]EFC42447.1 predicted protein [Naegleria gruberi]|eukprot:XP_002675191.1 predicted protein [Naegleria gruberi strain NEG-M]